MAEPNLLDSMHFFCCCSCLGCWSWRHGGIDTEIYLSYWHFDLTTRYTTQNSRSKDCVCSQYVRKIHQNETIRQAGSGKKGGGGGKRKGESLLAFLKIIRFWLSNCQKLCQFVGIILKFLVWVFCTISLCERDEIFMFVYSNYVNWQAKRNSCYSLILL